MNGLSLTSQRLYICIYTYICCYNYLKLNRYPRAFFVRHEAFFKKIKKLIILRYYETLSNWKTSASTCSILIALFKYDLQVIEHKYLTLPRLLESSNQISIWSGWYRVISLRHLA
jgi:hypothetical protein